MTVHLGTSLSLSQMSPTVLSGCTLSQTVQYSAVQYSTVPYRQYSCSLGLYSSAPRWNTRTGWICPPSTAPPRPTPASSPMGARGSARPRPTRRSCTSTQGPTLFSASRATRQCPVSGNPMVEDYMGCSSVVLVYSHAIILCCALLYCAEFDFVVLYQCPVSGERT